MKLYYAPGACSLSPHIVAREAGLPLELVRVDTKTHRLTDGSDFYAINPRGYVPVLGLADGLHLREGSAIVQFLADAAPQAGLIPDPATLERVRVQEWLNFIATEYPKQLIWLLRGAPEEVLLQQRTRITKVLGELDRRLHETPYLTGARFTVVDAYAFTITRWCLLPRVMLDLAPFQALRAFMARVTERPAVEEALVFEGLA